MIRLITMRWSAAILAPLVGLLVQSSPDLSSIDGTVTTSTSAPVPLAKVTLRQDSGVVFEQITSESGHFRFDRIPAGRYRLTAHAGGYLVSEFGSDRPARAGTPIVVSPRTSLYNAQLRLFRAGTLVGTVHLPDGDRASGVNVEALRATSAAGLVRSFDAAPHAVTDALGNFRITGLEPGGYVVAAIPRGAFAPIRSSDNASFIVRPPVFFPGTTDLRSAAVVTVDADREITGLALTLVTVPARRVVGRVNWGAIDPKGRSVAGQFLVTADVPGPSLFVQALEIAPDGRFEVSVADFGSYVLTIGSPNASDGAELIGGREVTPADFSGPPLTVDLTPTIKMDARVTLSPESAKRRDAPSVVLRISERPGNESFARIRRTSTLTPGGNALVLSGLARSEYDLAVSISGSPTPPPGWYLTRVSVDGIDITKAAIDLRGKDSVAVTVELGYADTELSGHLQRGGEASVAKYVLVALPLSGSPFHRPFGPMIRTRCASDGSFRFWGLPPGEYRLVVLDDLDDAALSDGSLPADLRDATGVNVSLANGTPVVQDIRIGGETES